MEDPAGFAGRGPPSSGGVAGCRVGWRTPPASPVGGPRPVGESRDAVWGVLWCGAALCFGRGVRGRLRFRRLGFGAMALADQGLWVVGWDSGGWVGCGDAPWASAGGRRAGAMIAILGGLGAALCWSASTLCASA